MFMEWKTLFVKMSILSKLVYSFKCATPIIIPTDFYYYNLILNANDNTTDVIQTSSKSKILKALKKAWRTILSDIKS